MFSIKEAINKVLAAADSIEQVNETVEEAVTAKSKDISFFWTDENGNMVEVSKAEADMKMAEAKTKEEKQLAALPFKSSDLKRVSLDQPEEEGEEDEVAWESMPTDFVKVSGFKLRVMSMNQFATYSGLNEKLPVEADTNRFIYNCIKRAEETYSTRAGSLISLAPVLRTKTQKVPKRSEFSGVVGDLRSELLPAVCSVAHLNNGRYDVVVVWFQDTYGLPPDTIRGELDKLDIKRVAKEQR